MWRKKENYACCYIRVATALKPFMWVIREPYGFRHDTVRSWNSWAVAGNFAALSTDKVYPVRKRIGYTLFGNEAWHIASIREGYLLNSTLGVVWPATNDCRPSRWAQNGIRVQETKSLQFVRGDEKYKSVQNILVGRLPKLTADLPSCSTSGHTNEVDMSTISSPDTCFWVCVTISLDPLAKKKVKRRVKPTSCPTESQPTMVGYIIRSLETLL